MFEFSRQNSFFCQFFFLLFFFFYNFFGDFSQRCKMRLMELSSNTFIDFFTNCGHKIHESLLILNGYNLIAIISCFGPLVFKH